MAAKADGIAVGGNGTLRGRAADCIAAEGDGISAGGEDGTSAEPVEVAEVADCVTAGCDEDGTSAVEVAECVTAGGGDGACVVEAPDGVNAVMAVLGRAEQ